MKNLRLVSVLSSVLAVGGALLIPASDARAALLAQYNFSDDSFASSDVNAQTEASEFGNSFSLLSDFSPRGNPGPSRYISFGALFATSREEAELGETYFNFTLAPTAGHSFSLTNLSFATDVGPDDTGTPPTVPDTGTFFVQANLSDENTFQDIISPFSQTATDTAAFQTNSTLDLSGFGFFTRPVEFRFFVFDSGAFGEEGGLHLDNIMLNGEVQGDVQPIPELPTSVLLALAGLGVGAWQRKRRTARPIS